MKYRKKPIVVEATQWFDFLDHPEVKKKWDCGEPIYYIDTLEGPMYVSSGDYIITGVKGEHYPCKPDVFELTYEVAE